MKNLAKLFTEIESNGAKFEMISYPDTYPAGEPQRRCPDLSKARADLNYAPKVHLKAGLQRFIDWCRLDEQYRANKK